MRTAKSAGATDPRYALGGGGGGGRTVPAYYLAEVRAGRARVAAALLRWGVPRAALPADLGYCASPSEGALTPTLRQMPVGPHQDVLDPCVSATANGEGSANPRLFERTARDTRSPPPRAYLDALAAFGAADPFELPAAKADTEANDDVRPTLQKMAAAERAPSGGGADSKVDVAADASAAVVKSVGRRLEVAVLHHHVPLYSRCAAPQFRRLLFLFSLCTYFRHRISLLFLLF
jgi:hypothetical protein